MKDEIKTFASECARKLMLPSTHAQIVTEFHGQQYLLSARSYMMSCGSILVEVRARPWISSLLAVNGGVPDSSKKTKTARAEFDEKFTMEEFVAKITTALFYNICGLAPEPEAE